MKAFDIFATAKPICETMNDIPTPEQEDCIKYNFEKCEYDDPVNKVHPVFRSTLKAMRGDYA